MADTEVSELVVTAGKDESVRTPRAVVQINGEDVDGLEAFSTSENEFSSPDTFTATWAMGGLPRGRGPRWFDGLERGAEVEILCGRVTDPASYSAADLPTVFVGLADDIAFDWVERTITVSGRDLTAKLMDEKTSEKHMNKRASDVAEALAAKHGLETDVTATTGRVGRLYKDANVDLQSERTEWDLLTWLAREEGFVTYLQGRTLYFGPRADAETSAPFVIRREAIQGAADRGNYVRLSTARTLTVSGDLTVRVRSWNAKRKAAFTKTATRKGRREPTGGEGGKQIITRSIPGLTPEETQRRAEQILAELSAHARKLEYEGPAFGLRISDLIRLEGTDTGFDEVFYPEAIGREFSVSAGYTFTISAKNIPTEDQPTL
jgi:phage protein D